MYTELTKEKLSEIVDDENFKGTLVHCDSPVCHYCARNMFHDPDFDAGKCEECGDTYSNFLGIECISLKEL